MNNISDTCFVQIDIIMWRFQNYGVQVSECYFALYYGIKLCIIISTYYIQRLTIQLQSLIFILILLVGHYNYVYIIIIIMYANTDTTIIVV